MMSSPASFQRTLRLAKLRLVYSSARSPEANIRKLLFIAQRVTSRLPDYTPRPPPLPPEKKKEVDLEIQESVLELPRRDRDPALVLQEINGCKSLLLEIIRRAAYDWVLYRTSRRLTQLRLAEDAHTWLFVETEDHPDADEREDNEKQVTSFEAICRALDLDPDDVRSHIRRLTPKNVLSVGRPAEYRRRESLPHAPEEASVFLGSRVLSAEWSDSEDFHED